MENEGIKELADEMERVFGEMVQLANKIIVQCNYPQRFGRSRELMGASTMLLEWASSIRSDLQQAEGEK